MGHATENAANGDRRVAIAPRDGHVRARRRYLVDERVDRVRGPRSRHDRERRAGGDRTGGAGLCRLHPDREQGRRPDRTQACIHDRSARVRDRCAVDDPRPRRNGDHRVLGRDRWTRRFAPAPGHAIADPRELRRRGTEEGLRARRGVGRDRRSDRAPPRWLHHDVPVVARRLPARGGGHRDRVVRSGSRAGRGLHRASSRRRRRLDPVDRRDGRHRARHLGMAGRWRVRRRTVDAGSPRVDGPRPLARPAQAAGEADVARPRPVPIQGVPLRNHGSDDATDRARRSHDRAPDLLADGPRLQRDADGSVHRAAVAHDVRRRAARREADWDTPAEQHHPGGLRAARHRHDGADRDRAARRFRLAPP